MSEHALKPTKPQWDSVDFSPRLKFQSSFTRGSQPDQRLVEDAIEKNDLMGLKHLYLQDVSSALGKTPLHMAAHWGHLSAVKYLLDQGENVNTLDSNGNSPLNQAIHAYKPEVASLILSKGATLSPGEDNANPLLHQIIRWDITKYNQEPLKILFHQLVKAGVNLNERDRWGNTPLIQAVKKENLQLVEWLIAAHASQEKEKGEWLPENAPSEMDDHTPRYLKHDSSTVTSPLSFVNVVGDDGLTPLYWACRRRNEPIASILLKEKATTQAYDKEGGTPLHWAVDSGNLSLIKLLLSHNALSEEDRNKKMPLSWAAFQGDIPAIDALLEAGSPINHPDSMGRTALYWAIHAGKTVCANHLIAKGSDIHQVSTINGRNFLHIAADTCNEQALNHLLKLKVNPLHRDFEGKTVVHQAAASGFTPTLEILESHGVDLKVLDQDGKNALHWTARFGSEECLEFLMARGLDLFHKDTLGKTPLDDAILTGNLAAVQHLFPLFAKSTEALQNPFYLSKFCIKSELANQKDISNWMYDELSESQRETIIPLIEKIRQWKSLPQQEAGHPVTNNDSNASSSSQLFIDLMPYLMTSEHLETLKPEIKKVETQFDYNPEKRNYHPNEAEFMLLLKHPDALSRDPKHIGFLTTAITGMTRFINPPTVTLSDSVVKAWGEIGFLSHAFRFWRFDSTKTKAGGPDDSLLTQFGFKPLISNTPVNQDFGKGFGYFDPDTGNRFEFRRGFLLAAHPDHGTLIIRNSSKHFGRDLLKHPAYFLPYALSEKDLETIDLKQIKDQYHILNRSLYENPGNNLHIPYLTQALMGLKEEYRRFKFDTQGFERIGVNRVFTGHHAPGLPKMVSFLQRLQEQGKPLPHLAFVNPDYPIYKPYGIFPLTPDHFKELTDFVTGQWTHQKYPQSQWIEFIHKYGVETRGELVMLDSQGPVPEILGD